MKTTIPCWLMRFLAPAGALALIASCIWAQTQVGLWAELVAIARMPWGAVTLGDLGAGLLIAGCWMPCLEPRRARAWILAALLLVVGNIATLAFVTLRCWGAPTLRAALTNRGTASGPA